MEMVKCGTLLKQHFNPTHSLSLSLSLSLSPLLSLCPHRLTQTPISDDDYEHAKHVFDTLQIPDLGSYALLYLFLDCYLLSK